MGSPAAATLSSTARTEILARIRWLLVRRRAGLLGDAQFAALYFLHWQIARHGSRFASRRYKSDPRPDAVEWLARIDASTAQSLNELLIAYLDRYQFHSVTYEVGAALCAWLRGEWKLVLIARVPKPSEVLKMQIAGSRPVSAICDVRRMFDPILEKRDAFVFLQHDLEHAFHFFSDPQLHRLQRRLFILFAAVIADGQFRSVSRDRVFRERFNYLISDMNTHPLHSLHYLRAVLVEHHLRAELGDVRGPLSIRAREQIVRVFRALATRGRFDAAAEAALLRLAGGDTSDADATVIERALRCESAETGLRLARR